MTDQPDPSNTDGLAAPPPGFYPDPDGSPNERFWDGAVWTEHTKSTAAPIAHAVATEPSAPPKKKKRVFMWFFLAVQLLFLIWVISGAAAGSGAPDDCASLDAALCNDASDVGTAIGVALIIVFWAVVDIILGFIYLVVRLARR